MTDWQGLESKTDEEIREAISNDPDACPELGEEFFKKARLNKLIKDLEGATVGSRELDERICNATNFKYSSGFSGDWDWHPSEEWPHYTTSIDAALTLVPEGDIASVSTDGHAVISSFNPVTAATPALALCIAALKARNNG